MVQAGPVRYGHLWRNLPLRIKAAVSLFLPVPMLALVGIGMGLAGTLDLKRLLAALAVAEACVVVWIIEAVLRRICGLQEATAKLVNGGETATGTPHSWELNRVSQNLQALASRLEQQRQDLSHCRSEAERLFDEAPSAYVETGDTGMVIRANRAACQFLGRSTEELCGKAAWEVFSADRAGGEERLLAQLSERAAVAAYDREYAHKDQTTALLTIQESLVRDASGAVSGLRYALTDRTPRVEAARAAAECERQVAVKEEERVRALADAAEAKEARARFLSNVSNDLRVPLNGIMGFAELLYDGKAGSLTEDHRECVDDILTSARNLCRVVDHLLDLSRVNLARPQVNCRTVNLEGLVYKARYVHQVLATQPQSVRIDLQLDPAVRSVPADPARLERLVTAYLAYAVRMAPHGGHVSLTTSAEGSTAFRIEVEASQSVSAPHREAVALPDPAAPELAQAAQLAEEMGGHAGVRRPPGRGVVLRAVLPIVPGVAVPEPLPRAATEMQLGGRDLELLRRALDRFGARAHSGCTVMVVGRELHTLDTLNSALQRFGYETVWLSELRNTLDMVAREQPSAVVVDLGDTGAEDHRFVLAALRSVGLSTPVIGFPCAEAAAPVTRSDGSTGARLQPVPGAGRRLSA